MQIIFTQGSMSKGRVLQFSRTQLVLAIALLLISLMLISGTIYHYFFLKAAREGWPVVSQIVRLVVRDETAQRDRYMRENLDVMAQKLGEMQAKLVKLDAVGERVAGLAGVKPADLAPVQRPAGAVAASAAQGGSYVTLDKPGMQELQAALASLDESVDRSADIFTLAESRLFEARLGVLMIPSSQPVGGHVGSGFGFRSDPFTGRAALHTGLDFPAESGTPIHAAAGGVVVTAEAHPQYGNLLEVDHGNQLVTRYAHASRFMVKRGDIVRRDQVIAEVGSTGRSTGPHLHFEVLVEGVPQDPARFLAGAANGGAASLAAKSSPARGR